MSSVNSKNTQKCPSTNKCGGTLYCPIVCLTETLGQFLLYLLHHLGVIPKHSLQLVAALCYALALVTEPTARLLDNLLCHAQISQFASLGDALAEGNLKLSLVERRRYLVLNDFHTCQATHHIFATLDARHTADVEAHTGIELKRVAASGSLGITKRQSSRAAD